MEGLGTVGKSTSPRESRSARPLTDRLDAAAQLSQQLNASLGDLETRLTPLMGPPGPQDACGSEKSVRTASPVVEHINETLGRLMEAISRINEIQRRLEV